MVDVVVSGGAVVEVDGTDATDGDVVVVVVVVEEVVVAASLPGGS